MPIVGQNDIDYTSVLEAHICESATSLVFSLIYGAGMSDIYLTVDR